MTSDQGVLNQREMNSYLEDIHNNLARLFSLYDQDETSASCGFGECFYWAWGLIDFATGPIQGAANSLSRLLVHDLLPDHIYSTKILTLIDAIFKGTNHLSPNYIISKNPSLEKLLPNLITIFFTLLGWRLSLVIR